MKRLLLFVILFSACAANVFSQSPLRSKNVLQARFDSLVKINRAYYVAGKTDSMPASNTLMLQLAEKINVDSTFVWAYISIGNYFGIKGDYSRALEYDFKAIEVADRGRKPALPTLYGNVAFVYNKLGNYGTALQYLHKGEKYLAYDHNSKVAIIEGIANAYVELKKPDSALKYIQIASQADLELMRQNIKNPITKSNIVLGHATIYNIFGRVYEMLHEQDLATDYYKKSIRLSDSLNLQVTSASFASRYGKYLLGQKKYDEAKNYVMKCFNTARKDRFKQNVVDAAALLYHLYDLQGNKDSAYYYLKAHLLYQDSIATEQRANQLQGVIIGQQLKEAEQKAAEEQNIEQRRRNIEYGLIALGIVAFVILFLLVSRSIVVNPRLIEVAGVIGLLIIFEFINLVIHPYLAEFTRDSPLPMLLILVAIAAIIVPLHHRLESWVKNKLVEKNKTIRLEAAKRTIEQFGEQRPERN